MSRFGKRSRIALASADPQLQKLFNEVIKYFDCSILEGHRNEADQNKAYKEGRSKVKYPNGNHNKLPSKAVDVIPYPIDWKDEERMILFIGYVLGTATQMGIKIRSGADWNRDTQTKDTRFRDLPHFELVM